MKNSFKRVILLSLAICFLASCALLGQNRKQDYGILKSAVIFSSDKVIGEYGEQIPAGFDGNRFMELVGDRIPKNYLHALENYKLEVESYGWYYLIKAFDGDAMILFDYSCTTEIDGPVLDSPGMFDLTNLGKYDGCK